MSVSDGLGKVLEYWTFDLSSRIRKCMICVKKKTKALYLIHWGCSRRGGLIHLAGIRVDIIKLSFIINHHEQLSYLITPNNMPVGPTLSSPPRLSPTIRPKTRTPATLHLSMLLPPEATNRLCPLQSKLTENTKRIYDCNHRLTSQ